jgi:hypothetical protein
MEVLQVLMKWMATHQDHGYEVEDQKITHICLPSAPFMTTELATYILEQRKTEGLTLAGNDIFKQAPDCQIFNNPRPGLVYLNLQGCSINDEGLAIIRSSKTLDTFIHESTILPGLRGVYVPSSQEGKQKSLKICIGIVSAGEEISSEELSRRMGDYTISGDTSLVSGLEIHYEAFEHPFMGPVSAVRCLQQLVKLRHLDFNSLPATSFFKGIFCQGYYPNSHIGLPVDMPSGGSSWPLYEDQGTRLMVMFCRGKTYACFSQRSNENGDVEWFTPQNYLVWYKNQFNGDMLDEVLKVCDELGDWCSKDDNISRHQLHSGQAVNHSGGQADNEVIYG